MGRHGLATLLFLRVLEGRCLGVPGTRYFEEGGAGSFEKLSERWRRSEDIIIIIILLTPYCKTVSEAPVSQTHISQRTW